MENTPPYEPVGFADRLNIVQCGDFEDDPTIPWGLCQPSCLPECNETGCVPECPSAKEAWELTIDTTNPITEETPLDDLPT